MLRQFKELIDRYSSKEVQMSDLRLIESSGIVSFDNQGISRSNRDCLLCVLTCIELSRFKEELSHCVFDSYERYEAFIRSSGLDLQLASESDDDYVIHRSPDGFYEVACSIEADGTVSIDTEDIKLQEQFNVYLRVQH